MYEAQPKSQGLSSEEVDCKLMLGDGLRTGSSKLCGLQFGVPCVGLPSGCPTTNARSWVPPSAVGTLAEVRPGAWLADACSLRI
mmetsp:Transcript_135024/g.305673  ORF Transcript_135024/g.305673 Transcript_135024/m.305673 type:complete len:84 (+) Transcript_135024:1806-2057(+)